jgi:hypothetical protein
MKQKYAARGLQVISVHTPEFEYEKERRRVERAAERYKLDQPIYMDNDYAYWNALGNRYWPSFYLVDRQGNLRARETGELHLDTDKGNAFEEQLRRLLAEDPS